MSLPDNGLAGAEMLLISELAASSLEDDNANNSRNVCQSITDSPSPSTAHQSHALLVRSHVNTILYALMHVIISSVYLLLLLLPAATTMKANGDSLAGATSVRVAPRLVLARPTGQ